MADATTTSRWHVTPTDEEVTVSHRSNRAATPLIDGRACQQRGRGQVDGGWLERAGETGCETGSAPDLYTISHELRNHVTSIKGWADLLLRRVEAGTEQTASVQALTPTRSSPDSMEE